MEALIDEVSGMDLSESPTAQKYAEKFDAEQGDDEKPTEDGAEATTPTEEPTDSPTSDTEDRGVTDAPPQEETKDVPESSKIDDIATQVGIPKEELLNSVLKEAKFPIKVKGKKMEVTYDEVIELTQKGAAFDKKSQKLSEDAKKGLVISAIESGDKSAMKKVLELMRDSASATDFDDLVSELEDIEGKIDEKKLEEDYEQKNLFDEAFGDVKKDVDFEKNLNTINTEMREFIPEDIFQSVLSKSEDFRTMYDLVATGVWTETQPVFNAKLNALPTSVRTQVESNFDMYMDMYADVLKSSRFSEPNQQAEAQTAPESSQTAPETSSEASTEDALSNIMSGTRSGGSNSAAKKVNNAMDLSKDEFEKMKKDFLDGKLAFKT